MPKRITAGEVIRDTSALLFENLISKKELAAKLSLSVRYIDKLMSDDGLPYFKIGRSVRFNCSDVLSWLTRRRMP